MRTATEAPGAQAGADRETGASARIAAVAVSVLTVAAAWWLLQAQALGRSPFHSHGEPREAVVVQDVLHRGTWILPRRNASQLARKPPLFYWLAAISAGVHGRVDEAAVRFPSAALSGLSSLLLAGTAAALYGGAAGLISGIALLTSFEWLRAATSARVDMTLTFGLTLAFLGLVWLRVDVRRPWLLLFYIGAAWAVLSKGIPGLVIPALAVALLCLVVDRRLAFAGRLRPIVGTMAVLVIAGAWYAAAATQGGRELLGIVVRENVLRIVADEAHALGHEHSAAYLVGVLVLGLLPWTVLLPSVGINLWRQRAAIDRRDPRVTALCWIAAVFIPYALASSKRGVYLLPLYPAASLLLGWWGAALARGTIHAPILRRLLPPAAWTLTGLLAVLAACTAAQRAGLPLLDLIIAMLPRHTAADAQAVAAAADATLVVILAIALAGAAALAAAAAHARWGWALASLAVCTGALVIAVRLSVLPAIAAAHTRRDFVGALRRVLANPAALHTTASLDYGTLFYWGAPIPVADLAAGDRPDYVLLPESTWVRLPAAIRQAYRRIPGLPAARGGDQGSVAVVQRRSQAAD